MKLKFKKLLENAVLPRKANPTDAGLDLTATSVIYDKELNVYIYNTSIKVEIPLGYFGMLAQRSSVYKTDLMLANNLGIIDHGYKESIKLIFRPTCKNPKIYNIGDRIGQLIVMPLPQFEPEFVDELDDTNDRGGGFGSSDR